MRWRDLISAPSQTQSLHLLAGGHAAPEEAVERDDREAGQRQQVGARGRFGLRLCTGF